MNTTNPPPRFRPGDIVRCGGTVGRVAWIAQDNSVYVNHSWPKQQTRFKPAQLSHDVPPELHPR